MEPPATNELDAVLRDPTVAAAARQLRLGETLIERGLVTPEQLDVALALQRESGRRTGELLVAMHAVKPGDLARLLAERLGRPFVDGLAVVQPDVLVAHRVPEELARRYRALPVAASDDGLVVAMADPDDVFAMDDIHLVTRTPIVAAFADPDLITDHLNRIWSRANMESEFDSAAEHADDDTAVALDDLSTVGDSEAPIIRLVNALIDQAVEERASDIHLEPGARSVLIRFRVDGILREVSEAPLGIARTMVSRVKVLANLDIANTRTSQDGRFSMTVGGRVVDLRVVTLPTATGEAVVIRLLDRSADVQRLTDLSLDPDVVDVLVAQTNKPQGAIIVTGPTGSGKTTTLYAATAQVNAHERSILTVEDPVEYHLPMAKQIQIDPKVGRTFAGVLRAALRADPDVILVGEIRDHETARIAAEAAITGHLVLSTMHTTSAAAAPIRLVDMGVERFLVASAVSCIVAQRLLRKVCGHCAVPDDRALVWAESVGADDPEIDLGQVRRAVGCSRCRNTGYAGRLSVLEVMVVSEDIRRLIIGRATTDEIERWAMAEGMEPLRVAAARRVLDGSTTIDEMMRVVV